MEGDFIKIYDWLRPLSWLYGLGVGFRNQLFELGILRSRSFSVPVISVGNITVGGSGKTPHVEYLIRLLQDKAKVAVLSRGYKRKSRGYLLAEDDTPMRLIGDEPYQMKRKFPKIHVAVDKKRCEGIDRLTSDEATCDTDVVLLDDAYQHRYVKPGINILLVDYHRLILYDELLPAGRLREPKSGKDRADIVIITKCPPDLKPVDYRVLTKAMNIFPYQELYFSCLAYDELHRLFGEEKRTLDSILNHHVLLLTGIASPRQMELDLTPYVTGSPLDIATRPMEPVKPSSLITPLSFPDHHAFKAKDIRRINEVFESLPEPKLVITTEKDAARLERVEGLSEALRKCLYVLPLRIQFMLDQEEKFNDKIISYVRKNTRNSLLAQSKDAHKSKNRHHSGHGPRTISFRNNRQL